MPGDDPPPPPKPEKTEEEDEDLLNPEFPGAPVDGDANALPPIPDGPSLRSSGTGTSEEARRPSSSNGAPMPPSAFQQPSASPPIPSSSSANVRYQVLLGSFSTREAAEEKVAQLQSQGFSGFIKGGGSSYAVQLGVFSTREAAENVANATGASINTISD